MDALELRSLVSESESDSDSVDDAIIDLRKLDYKNFEKTISNLEKYRENLEIIIAHGRSSFVWKYFGKLMFKKTEVFLDLNFCSPCLSPGNTEFKLKPYSGTTSTNVLKQHLLNVHNIFESNKKVTSIGNQLTIKSLFNKDYPVGSADSNSRKANKRKDDKYRISRQIAVMCALDFEPFNVSEKRGFAWFCRSNGIINLPTGKNIGETALSDMYLLFYKEVKKILTTAPVNMSIILDCWTDNYVQRPYINIKVHFCTDFRLHAVTLKTSHFPRPHTGDRINKYVEETLCEFDLLDKNWISVTDNGSNIISGLRQANIKRLPCILHNISLFINTDILQNEKFTKFRGICCKLKKIYGVLTYKHDELININSRNKMVKFLETLDEIIEINISIETENSITNELLDIGDSIETENTNELCTNDSISDKLHSLNDVSKSLKNSNVTRWNSTLSMIESFCENATTVNIALGHIDRHDLVIGSMEKSLLLSLKSFLKIFKDCTNILQGVKYPTLNLQILFLIQMKKMLREQAFIEPFDLVTQLYDFAIANIEKRFIISEEHIVASLLDPTQKNLQEIINYLPGDKTKKTILIEKIKYYELDKVTVADSDTNSNVSLGETHKRNEFNASSAKKARLSILENLQTANSNINEDICYEVNMYYTSKCDIETEALDWWKQNQHSFPKLSCLAQIYLGIPASSSSSEMAFSTAGNFLTAKRSRLHPAKLNKLCFIHDNYDLCHISNI